MPTPTSVRPISPAVEDSIDARRALPFILLRELPYSRHSRLYEHLTTVRAAAAAASAKLPPIICACHGSWMKTPSCRRGCAINSFTIRTAYTFRALLVRWRTCWRRAIGTPPPIFLAGQPLFSPEFDDARCVIVSR